MRPSKHTPSVDANSPPQEIHYSTKDAPTLKLFHNDDSFVRGIMGPVGSGKSTACVIEILTRAQAQKKSPDGKRYTRWAIIRNTYPELKTTTLKTWGYWVPPTYGNLTMTSPITHRIKTEELDIEVLFLALDQPQDVKKLLSLELTGAWINEAREIPKAIVDVLTTRVGRFPTKNMGGPSWFGTLMDTNPPDDMSWWYKFSEQEVPEGWRFFKQPPGDSVEAENVPNLPQNYYKNIAAGKDQDWINVYVKGTYGYVIEGKPVYPMYRERIHTVHQGIVPVKGLPLLLGVDFGLTPAAVIAQKLPNGQWLALDEFLSEDCGIKRFAENLGTYLKQAYPDHEVHAGWGDPAGEAKNSEERTCFEIMNEYFPIHWYEGANLRTAQWKAAPCPSNDTYTRLEVVKNALNRLIDGEPGVKVNAIKCKTLRKGFISGYYYKFVKAGDGERTQEIPYKNKFSHIHDAFQYLLLGGGEYSVVMRKSERERQPQNRVVIAQDTDYNMFKMKI